MPFRCVAYKCGNEQGLCEQSFHRFPEDKPRREAWEAAIRREGWKSTEYSRLCGAHFITGKPSKDPTHVDFIPTLFSYTTPAQRIVLERRVQKHEQMLKMRMKRLECQTRSELNQTNRNRNLLHLQPTDHNSVDVDEPPHDPETIPGSVNDVNDDSMMQPSTGRDEELQQALMQIEDLTSKLKEREQLCGELECVVVELNSRVKELESVIMTLKARDSESESIIAALDVNRKELHSSLTECVAKREELELRVSELCRINAELEKRNAELKKDYEAQKDSSDHGRKELKEEIATLKSKCISMEGLKDNEKYVKFYTGLPDYDTLKAVLDLASKCLPSTVQHGLRKLTNDDEFLLTIIKLRLNLRNADLGFRFGIAESTVSNIIHKWLNILYASLKFVIRWPTREEVRATLPECFRPKFQNAIVIVDCTEVFIERATNLLARSQTWSNYKSHNTVKYLIGITPQGTVSFVSRAWGGRVSDKQITQECGILRLLLPGDLVLADRGFNIYELVAIHQAEAKLPAFTKGKAQLSAKEVQDSRELAVVRIHVERLIGVIKQKYSILEGTLPINFIKADGADVSVADKLMAICCALVNLCEPLVPSN